MESVFEFLIWERIEIKSMMVPKIKRELLVLADPANAEILMHFFKTKKEEYGEGDHFLGVKVSDQRKIAKRYFSAISENELEELICSTFHEERLTAIFILVFKFQNSNFQEEKKKWVEFYLRNKIYVNNWDLVDSSAHQVLGAWLIDKDRSIIFELTNSNRLWDQRIAIICTYHFIKRKDFTDTLIIAERLIYHPHHLIHKAVGWMIREIGNRDFEVAHQFLSLHYQIMPRTMLRYAIEKFDPVLRQKYLKGLI